LEAAKTHLVRGGTLLQSYALSMADQTFVERARETSEWAQAAINAATLN
jgi:hypothetical protein